MKRWNPDKYIIINCIFAGIIFAVFTYSFIYEFKGMAHPIPSGKNWLHQPSAISTGLSRSFSAITHLNMDQAKQLNPYGIQIFLFFMIQLLLRIAGTILYSRSSAFYRKRIVIADVVLSGLMFVLIFRPFIVHLTRVYSCS